MTPLDLRRGRPAGRRRRRGGKEEGRGVRGAGGRRGLRRFTGRTEVLVAVVAIAMSLYHLYAAYAIIPAHILRATTSGSCSSSSTCSSPPCARSETASAGTTWCWRCSVSPPSPTRSSTSTSSSSGRSSPRGWTSSRRHPHPARAGGRAPHLGAHPGRGGDGLHRLRLCRPVDPRAVHAPWVRRGASRRPALHDPRGHLRHRPRRVGHLHRPLHHLRRGPGLLRRGRVLHRLLARGGGGKRAAAGRTIVLSSFLLGGPSGSGVATTVTIGSVAWPMLAKAGYPRDAAGGLLAAGGLAPSSRPRCWARPPSSSPSS